VTPLFFFDLNLDPGPQLTFPLTDDQSTLFPSRVIEWWDNDFGPALSPNGQEIAYFRSRERFDSGLALPRLSSIVSIRIVGVNGTNDREVGTFSPGTFPTQLSWSPDGTQLVHNLGTQLFSDGFPLFQPDPSTTGIWLINASGPPNPTLIRSPAMSPSWAPGFGGADSDGDGIPDASDNCPSWRNPGQGDFDENGRGDDCECGDQNLDGTVDVSDILAINGAIFDPSSATPLCDANHDQACDVTDSLEVNTEIFSPGPTSICARQPAPGP
jgi:hypothetical protein